MECPDVQSPVGKSKLARLGHFERLGIAARSNRQRKRMVAAGELPPPVVISGTFFLALSGPGRNPAECGHLQPFIRTTGDR
jgi:hypothetical protein